jgi:hypothetical protein
VTKNWPLKAFGKQARDTSSVANLAHVQKVNETVQKFSRWVVVASDEFFLAMDAQEEPNFMAIIAKSRMG